MVRVFVCFVLLLLIPMSGCGRSDGVAVYPVSGKITLNGQPMKGGGSISFIPTSNQKGKTPGGEIKEDGTYAMSTYGAADGSMAGDFRVVINQVTVHEPESVLDGSGQRTKKPTVLVEPKDQIPAIYGNLDKSPLTAKVEAKPNVIDFDIKKP